MLDTHRFGMMIFNKNKKIVLFQSSIIRLTEKGWWGCILNVGSRAMVSLVVDGRIAALWLVLLKIGDEMIEILESDLTEFACWLEESEIWFVESFRFYLRKHYFSWAF